MEQILIGVALVFLGMVIEFLLKPLRKIAGKND